MALDPGTRFGPYEITGLIGAGGMGEVYRATDTKLGRDVAIKTLPSALASDADRLARFEREAKLLAALNHAHIASIYGLDEHEGTQYLAMELVDGETLEEKLKAGALATEDALPLALQIAEALEAAHESGVVHRDLKPANVMVTPAGQVKVLDFGLAKAFSGNPNEASPAHSPALSVAMTQAGLVLGTAGYMSPEQASGQATDQRADVWAFGVVLYEMLTGLPVFSGESVPHILAAVLRIEPEWNQLPKNMHPRLRQTLERCLEKKARNRYHSIADVRVDIEKVLSDPHGISAYPAEAATGPQPAILPRIAAAVLVAVVLGGIAVWQFWPSPEPRPVTRFTDSLGAQAATPVVRISHDGARIGYAAGSPPTIYVREMDDFVARPVPGLEDEILGAAPPCFSSDGSWLAYPAAAGSELRKVPVTGGRGLTVAAGLGNVFWCDWAEDGNIYFSDATGTLRVSDSGGTVETIASLDAEAGEVVHALPQLLPGGTQLLFSKYIGDLGNVSVVVHDLLTNEQTTVLERAGGAVYAQSGSDPTIGHLVYGQSGALFAAPFDLNALEARSPSPVLDGVFELGPFTLATVSSTGTLVYAAGDLAAGIGATLSWMDRDGIAQELPAQREFYGELTLAPDGQHAVLSMFDLDGLTSDLWVYEFDGGRLTRVTFDGSNINPVWSPDGQRLIYANFATPAGSRPTLRAVPADNSGPPVTLASPQQAALPTSIHPDGTALIGHGVQSGADSQDIWVLPLDDDPSSESTATDAPLSYLLETSFDERHASFSPDGNWVAYGSNESGTEEIYVVPYPGPGGKTQVSTDGGERPRWHPNGAELFYISGSRMMAVEVETGTAFRAQTPELLFDDPALLDEYNSDGFPYDFAPDGDQFLLPRPGIPTGDQATELRIVQNWFEELRELAPMD